MSTFPLDRAPFSELTPALRSLLAASAVKASFHAGDPVLTPEMEPTQAYLIASGHVEQFNGDEAVAVFGPGEIFGARAVLAARASHRWQALDELHVWAIPRSTLQALVGGHAGFCSWLFGQISRRLVGAAQRDEQREFLSLMMARVQDAYVRKPFYVDASTPITEVCRLLRDAGSTTALVRDGERTGMFTTTDLRDALLRPVAPAQLPVREVAQFDLVSVNASDELYEALLLMLRHRVHRVVVREGAAIVGVLSQLDLMSFVSNHSHLIAMQVEQAENLADLKAAALQLDGLVELLHSGGVKVPVIAGLVRVLNEQVFRRLWSFVAPPELQANSCLVVMGSEGRGEQILKTDQDNGLLLRDGFEFAELEAVTQAFNAGLSEFGYPACPGNIMLTNPLWCSPVQRFRQTIYGWFHDAQPEGPMQLAIFMDAVAVTGDAALLAQVRAAVTEFSSGNALFLARFAAATDQFTAPATGWWSRLTGRLAKEEPLFDLKKLGTFPIVHGVRALALEQHLDAVSTTERLRALVQRQVLNPQLARDLTEVLHFMMGLKMKNNLRQRQLGLPENNLVALAELGVLERDQLREALAVVKQFRQLVAQRFHLDLL